MDVTKLCLFIINQPKHNPCVGLGHPTGSMATIIYQYNISGCSKPMLNLNHLVPESICIVESIFIEQIHELANVLAC